MKRDCFDCPRATEGEICPGTWEHPHKPCADHLAAKSAERAAILAKIKIRTENVFPPIPIRDYDWSAVDDNGAGTPAGLTDVPAFPTTDEMLTAIAGDLEFELAGQPLSAVMREIVGRLHAYGMSPTSIEDALTGLDVSGTE